MTEQTKNKTFALKGTARYERLQKALLPDYAPVDERKLSDLLSFATEYAKVINFYNFDNKIASDWSPFFQKDISVFLANIIAIDIKQLRHEIQSVVNRLYKSPEGDSRHKLMLFRIFFHATLQLAEILNDLYIRSFQLRKVTQETRIEQELEMMIDRQLKEALGLMKAYDLGAKEEAGIDAALGGNYDLFHPIWRISKIKPINIFQGDDFDEKITNATKTVQLVFRRFDFGLTNIIGIAPSLLELTIKDKKDHQPDIALFIAFLQLYQFNQDQINTFTEKHLDYYYRKVLQQTEQKRQPDHTHVVFELSEHVDRYVLKKGTRLLADVSDDGLESQYECNYDQAISKAKIESLKTIFVSKPPFAGISSTYKLVGNIFMAPIANSKDGIGAPFDLEDSTWPTFGEEQADKAQEDQKMIPAAIGFMIASPIFLLGEGDRQIHLSFKLKKETLNTLRILLEDTSDKECISVDEVFIRIFRDSLRFQFSGAENWIRVSKYELSAPSTWVDGRLEMHLSVPHSEAAIVKYNEAILGCKIETVWPVLKVELNSKDCIYSYSFLKKMELERIDIEVAVKGMKNLTISNNLGLLDNTAPFQPFGLSASKNAYFLLSSPELFNKKVNGLDLKIDWDNLPEEGFETYYEGYDQTVTNDCFKVKISALSDYKFQPIEESNREEVTLFQSEKNDLTLSDSTILNNINLDKLNITPDYDLDAFPEYSNQSKTGFLKIQLTNPSFGFGTKEYPIAFANAIAENAKSDYFQFLNLKKKTAKPIPREPFVPVVNQLTIDYTAFTSLDIANEINNPSDQKIDEKIFHIHPFGVETIFENNYATQTNLLPQYDEEGYLYIGIRDIRPLENLSILFLMETSKESYNKKPVEVKWKYLCEDRWLKLAEKNILFNSTENFTKTGIVSLEVPMNITKDNTQLDGELYWVRVSVRGNKEVLGRTKKIVAHALEATWVDNGDLNHFQSIQTLPRIKELVKPVAEVNAVSQPDDFFGGRPAETKDHFYLRVSERLRHKGRGLTIWDIERLVLEQFPSIHQVKCFGNAGNEEFVKPGVIKIVVVPKIKSDHEMPKVGFDRLIEISRYLKPIISPVAEIDVINPVYEKVVINCDIKFKEEVKGEGLAINQLHEDIRHLLCPWLKGASLGMGGSIIQSELLNFIKDRSYVKFITSFSLLHVIETADYFSLVDSAKNKKNTQILQASMPWSVLVPVKKHQVNLISKEVFKPSEITLINKMRLGTEFIISSTKDDDYMEEWLPKEGTSKEEEEEQNFWISDLDF